MTGMTAAFRAEAPHAGRTPGAPAWTVMTLDAAQSGEIRTLFETVFGRPMSQALWNWKYADGRGAASGVRWRSGALVAHYGGTRRGFRMSTGLDVTAVHIGDVMVHPQARDIFSRRGPFGAVTAHFIDTHCHADAGGQSFGFGFPNARHMRLGRLLGLYDALDDVFEVRADVQAVAGTASTAPMAPRVHGMDGADATLESQFSPLWSRMRADLAGLGHCERPWAWWRHRYANHPEHRHQGLWLLESGAVDAPPVAALVLRRDTTPGVWELLDWVAPLALAPRIWAAAARYVAQAGGHGLIMWGTAAVVRAMALGQGGGIHPACALAVTCRQGGVPAALAHMRGQMWVMGGDTDFR